MTKRIDTLDLVQGSIWAIHPDKLDEILTFVERRMEGESAKVADPGKSGNKAADRYVVTDGVATIPVFGSLTKRANMLTEFSGGTSYQLLKRDIQAAMKDKKVTSILLEIDSPGGLVDGLFDVTDYVYSQRGRKPITAISDGMVTSAAYLLASATDEISLGPAALAGSIGVLAVHYDRSEQDKMIGIKRTDIFAGQYKAMGSDAKPLDSKARDYLQERVDYQYSLFVDAVAKYRGITVDEALQMADGKIFIGQQALDVGLVDHIGHFETGFKRAKTRGVQSMNAQAILDEHPALYREIFEAGAKSRDAEVETARVDGIKAERERCIEIMAQDAAPLDARLQALKNGSSTADAYKLFFDAKVQEEKARSEAEGKERAEQLKQLEGKEGAGHSAKEKNKGEPPDFMVMARDYAKENNCSMSKAMETLVREKSELHARWLEGQRGGK